MMCAWLCFYFLSLFTVLLLGAHFPILMFTRAYIIVSYFDVGRKLSINGYYFIFLGAPYASLFQNYLLCLIDCKT